MTTLGSPGLSSQSVSGFSGRKRLKKPETDWDDNARKPRSLIDWVIDDFSPPTISKGNETRLILAALQAHHKQKLRVCTKTHTMIIICTMSTPLSSIRFLLSAQVLSAQGQTETNLSLVKQPRHGITRACSHRKTVLLFNQACKRLK